MSKTLAQLQDEIRQVVSTVRALGVKADAGTNIFDNRTEVYVASSSSYDLLKNSDISLLQDLEIVEVDSLATPAVSNFYRGLYLGGNGCTSGFTVLANSNNARGMLTAGHCGNTAYWGSGTDTVNLNFVSQRYDGAFDVQWHKPASNADKLKPWTKDDTCSDTTPCYRVITGVVNRPEQPIGAWVCGYGNTTDFRCGYIRSKTFSPGYVANATETFVLVGRDRVDFSEPGDSGGPWYKGGSAFGIMSGQRGHEAIYMAINYIDLSLDVRVATGL